jgi:hypothetical protein
MASPCEDENYFFLNTQKSVKKANASNRQMNKSAIPVFGPSAENSWYNDISLGLVIKKYIDEYRSAPTENNVSSIFLIE